MWGFRGERRGSSILFYERKRGGFFLSLLGRLDEPEVSEPCEAGELTVGEHPRQPEEANSLLRFAESGDLCLW